MNSEQIKTAIAAAVTVAALMMHATTKPPCPTDGRAAWRGCPTHNNSEGQMR